MDPVSLIIQLLSGAAGGNVAGSLLKNLSLGTLGNSLSGVVGGPIGSFILAKLIPGMGAVSGAAGAGGLDIGSILGQIAGGGIGGGALMAIIGLVKSMMAGGSKS